MKKILFFFLFLGAAVQGTEIISSTRKVTWQGNVGISGGIPNVTTIFTNFTSAATRSAVQSALESCPSNQVVKLGAWTNTWTGDLDWQGVGNGVVLRGTTNASGVPVTKINASTAIIYMRTVYDSTLTSVNLTANATKDGTTLTVASVPSWVKVGYLIGVDQLDESALSTTTGQEGLDQTRSGRGMNQLCKVVSTTATTITVELPLYYGFKTSQTAQIFKPDYDPSTQMPRKRCGIEDIRMEHTGSATDVHMIKLENCDECWFRNFWGTNIAGGIYIFPQFSYRGEVRHCRFDNSHQLGGGQGYGVGLYHYSCGWLIEDNIFRKLHVSMQNNYGSSGNVFAYNFETDGQSDSGQNPGINAHGSTGYQVLWEGNYLMDKVNGDYVHGSSDWNTVFRNRVLGKNPTQTLNQSPISIEKYNRQWNIVGNVLGDKAYHSSYDAGYGGTGYNASSCLDNSALIYLVGFWSNWGCDTTTAAGDSNTTIDLLRAVNYDVVTSTNNGIALGGFVLGDLNSSYYLSSKPSFFGALAWPAYGPDVANSTNSLSYTNIPAGYRYNFGTEVPASSGGGTGFSTQVVSNLRVAGNVTIK